MKIRLSDASSRNETKLKGTNNGLYFNINSHINSLYRLSVVSFREEESIILFQGMHPMYEGNKSFKL